MPKLNYKKTEKHKNNHRLSVMAENHYRSQLTNTQVREIRKKDEEGKTTRQLSMEYNVSMQTIQKIIKRYTWKYI